MLTGEPAPPKPKPPPHKLPFEPEAYNTPAARMQARALMALMTSEDDELQSVVSTYLGGKTQLDDNTLKQLRGLLVGLNQLLRTPNDTAGELVAALWKVIRDAENL